LLLGRVSVGFRGALQPRRGRGFDQPLGCRQTKAGLHFADGLDGGNFLVRRGGHKNHVKRGLRFSDRRSSTRSRSSGSHRCGGSHAPLGFQLFHQVGGFENRQLAQFLYEVCNISHVTFLVVSSSAAATAILSSRPVNRRFTLLLFVCPTRWPKRTEIVLAFLGLRLD